MREILSELRKVLDQDRATALAERFTDLALVDGVGAVEEAPTYRGEGQCFG